MQVDDNLGFPSKADGGKYIANVGASSLFSVRDI